jgi:hypothetical protein
MPHVNVKGLPQSVQRMLYNNGFRNRDIELVPSETFTMQSAYGAGYRAFTVVLDMASGASKRIDGSWGGANPFESRAVDVDDSAHPLPVNGVAFVASGKPGWGRLFVRPDQVAPLLPPVAEVTDRDRSLLAIFGGIKAGPYRREELARANATDAEVSSLVTRGFLKVATNGATSITTEGKNARGKARPL